MSGLSYICDYGSSSEEEKDCEIVKITKRKFPLPNLNSVRVVASDIHRDDPELHDGRLRSFPHVRGNWATFVYVKYPGEDTLVQLIEKLEKKVLLKNELWQRCNDYHISLTKTFVLKYHLISPLTSSLHQALNKTESFDLGFSEVKVFCNEDSSRTFISLQVDYFSQRFLHSITKKVDEVLTDFKLPTFYEDPSFHMSIFWIKGNKKSEVAEILNTLNNILSEELEKSFRTILVDKINCKSGNKHYQYFLT